MGIFLGRKLYSHNMREAALVFIKIERCFVNLPTDSMKGRRFNDDDSVFDRLESATNEKEFARRPLEAVDAALIDAAKSDHWYEYEKDWGDDEEDQDDD